MGAMSKNKPTIVWDVDDVLNPLTQAWFEGSWRSQHSGCTVAYDQIVDNPPHALLGISRELYLESLDEFRMSDAYSLMEPVPAVLDWFRSYGAMCRHVALTATPLRTAPGSADWVLRHFGEWIRSYNFVPSKRPGVPLPEYDRTKEDFLAGLGRGDILVDDSPQNIEGAVRVGLKTILIPQPWNQSRQTLTEALQALTKLF